MWPKRLPQWCHQFLGFGGFWASVWPFWFPEKWWSWQHEASLLQGSDTIEQDNASSFSEPLIKHQYIRFASLHNPFIYAFTLSYWSSFSLFVFYFYPNVSIFGRDIRFGYCACQSASLPSPPALVHSHSHRVGCVGMERVACPNHQTAQPHSYQTQFGPKGSSRNPPHQALAQKSKDKVSGVHMRVKYAVYLYAHVCVSCVCMACVHAWCVYMCWPCIVVWCVPVYTRANVCIHNTDMLYVHMCCVCMDTGWGGLQAVVTLTFWSRNNSCMLKIK